MIGFRVDANEHIATGHMMRSIAIAEACREKGEDCIFLLAEEKETLRLIEHEFPFLVLNSKWNDLESEIAQLIRIIKKENITRLVVDSYQATSVYLKKLNTQVPVLYIDDMALDIYDVSIVLHYSEWPGENIYSKKYESTDTKVLSGMQYVPLREEFFTENSMKERDKSILITTGGTDPFNVTGKLLNQLLKHPELAEYTFHTIVGSMNQNEQELKILATSDRRIHLHKNIKNMGEYMKFCKCAVSAGGTTLYELCACGTPTVCFSFADNQEEFVAQMGERKIMISAGDARKDEKIEQKICNGLQMFLKNEKIYTDYAYRMQKLIDGKGTERIAENICR